MNILKFLFVLYHIDRVSSSGPQEFSADSLYSTTNNLSLLPGRIARKARMRVYEKINIKSVIQVVRPESVIKHLISGLMKVLVT